MTIPFVTIKQATLAYNDKCLFKHINLLLPAGRWVALLGPSGVGKSSLLKLIAGLKTDGAATGIIEASNHINPADQAAYMGQTDLLLPWLTALENTCLGARLRHEKERSLVRERASDLLDRAGLGRALSLYPHQLSGGMRQRVALVRTLMENKPLILMDEPFSALDAITRHQLQQLAADMLRNKTVLFITHDPSEALRLAHRVYVMQGTPATLKEVSCMTTDTPRDLSSPTIARLQAQLLHDMANPESSAA